MKTISTNKFGQEFKPLVASASAQFAIMTLPPGGKSDEGVANEHPCSEQWLFVISGNGIATVVSVRGKKRRVKLKTGSLLLIEKSERHQIKNSGRKPLRTLNFYTPPAYKANGEVRKSATG